VPLTVHAGTSGPAVAVRGELVEAVGSREELTARFPEARVRDWAGELGPALTHAGPVPAAPSPRERIHALFRLGATSVPADAVADPALRAAAARAGLRLLPAGAPPPPVTPGARADPIPGARADLAVFTPDGRCQATVLAGRLVHRRA
jgi:hypothetical protein